jgi:hypothetical protein
MPESEAPKVTIKEIARITLWTCLAVSVAVVLVQLTARLITGKTLGGPGAAIGVPVGIMVATVLRKSRRRKS